MANSWLDYPELEPTNYSEIVGVLLARLNELYPTLYVSSPDEDLSGLSELLPSIIDREMLEEYLATDFGKGVLIGLLTAYTALKQSAEDLEEYEYLD